MEDLVAGIVATIAGLLLLVLSIGLSPYLPCSTQAYAGINICIGIGLYGLGRGLYKLSREKNNVRGPKT